MKHVRKVLALMGVYDWNDMKRFVREAVLFAVVGAIDMAVQYTTFNLLWHIHIFQVEWYYTFCNTIAIFITWLTSYVLYTLFVFTPKKDADLDKTTYDQLTHKVQTGRQIFRMIVTNAGYVLISAGLIEMFVRGFHVKVEIAPVLCIAVMIPYSFLMQRLWVYREEIKKGR